MTISVGSKLPDAKVLVKQDGKLEHVSMAERLAGRNVVIFGLPGAYTSTCSTSHVPSFMRVADKLRAKGVDEIMCLSVNDADVMQAWGKVTGGTDKGITFVADTMSNFTLGIGMEFSIPAIGWVNRSNRYALYAVDGVVKVLNIGEETNACEISGGETMLAAI